MSKKIQIVNCMKNGNLSNFVQRVECLETKSFNTDPDTVAHAKQGHKLQWLLNCVFFPNTIMNKRIFIQ